MLPHLHDNQNANDDDDDDDDDISILHAIQCILTLLGLSIYFLYNITVFENIQHNIILQQLYNGIQEKVI